MVRVVSPANAEMNPLTGTAEHSRVFTCGSAGGFESNHRPEEQAVEVRERPQRSEVQRERVDGERPEAGETLDAGERRHPMVRARRRPVVDAVSVIGRQASGNVRPNQFQLLQGGDVAGRNRPARNRNGRANNRLDVRIGKHDRPPTADAGSSRVAAAGAAPSSGRARIPVRTGVSGGVAARAASLRRRRPGRAAGGRSTAGARARIRAPGRRGAAVRGDVRACRRATEVRTNQQCREQAGGRRSMAVIPRRSARENGSHSVMVPPASENGPAPWLRASSFELRIDDPVFRDRVT